VYDHKYQNTILYKSNTAIVCCYYYYVECQIIDMFRHFIILTRPTSDHSLATMFDLMIAWWKWERAEKCCQLSDILHDNNNKQFLCLTYILSYFDTYDCVDLVTWRQNLGQSDL